jgi:hypothetical protein
VTHPLIAELAVAVVRRPLDRKRHGTENQRPLDSDLVHQWAAQEANDCKHGVVDGV